MDCKKCRHNEKGHNCFPAQKGTRCRGATEQLQAELKKIKALTVSQIKKGLDNLNAGQISIIKDGIEQMGKIGHYGKSFIVTRIIEQALEDTECFGNH